MDTVSSMVLGFCLMVPMAGAGLLTAKVIRAERGILLLKKRFLPYPTDSVGMTFVIPSSAGFGRNDVLLNPSYRAERGISSLKQRFLPCPPAAGFGRNDVCYTMCGGVRSE